MPDEDHACAGPDPRYPLPFREVNPRATSDAFRDGMFSSRRTFVNRIHGLVIKMQHAEEREVQDAYGMGVTQTFMPPSFCPSWWLPTGTIQAKNYIVLCILPDATVT